MDSHTWHHMALKQTCSLDLRGSVGFLDVYRVCDILVVCVGRVQSIGRLVLAPDVWVGCDGKVGPHQSWPPEPFLPINWSPGPLLHAIVATLPNHFDPGPKLT